MSCHKKITGDNTRLARATHVIWADNLAANSSRRFVRLYSSRRCQLFSNGDQGPPK